ncbi:hypothetical protein CBR_g50234 [Chara braunii]|uniref:Arsenosugar biosynthesis radical SAM protein ArsS-like C-terminal domain-containing protein n=1 Tax=Chara braunii TaxID=69332 RepID=A0A388M6H6_CHABU|nr:hypothetical protein CBR_g50234 [Chara braunii]|eukprot:GBG90140.1 hypothetical protein CBR_g50234 [Chara braunii]
MDHRTAEHIVNLLERSKEIAVVDLTGGAPELNPAFRYLVKEARQLGKEVIDRCNLTVLFVEGQEHLADFLAENQVRVVASLPCYTVENVSKQRGGGVFKKSIAALQMLNSLGYGKEEAFLPAAQDVLQAAYKTELFEAYGITFNNLFTVTNMPIKRFADYLYRKGEMESYMNLLLSSFNPVAVDGVMRRDMVSVGWDGALFNCDFNQQLGLGVGGQSVPSTVFDLQSFDQLIG